MDEQKDRQTGAWVIRWREAAVALDEIKREELRSLSQEESGRWFAEMTVNFDTCWISPERSEAVGMIEQQRIFMCSHEHPARHRRRL